jgi:hypothetical protein
MIAKGLEIMLVSPLAHGEYCYFGNIQWKAHDKMLLIFNFIIWLKQGDQAVLCGPEVF